MEVHVEASEGKVTVERDGEIVLDLEVNIPEGLQYIELGELVKGVFETILSDVCAEVERGDEQGAR